MPEMRGVEFCSVIKRQFPEKKVIALTGELDPILLYNTWMNNVDAILMKYCRREELIDTIHAVLNGQRIIGDTVPGFYEHLDKDNTNTPKISPGEQNVLSLLAKGYSRKEVGSMLGTSLNAVDFHCKNLFKKFNSNKIMHIIEEAKKKNLININ